MAQRHVGVSSFVKLVVEGVVGALVALIVLIAVVSNLPVVRRSSSRWIRC